MQASASNFIKKETLAQVFSCEFCDITKNTFSYRTSPMAALLVPVVINFAMSKSWNRKLCWRLCVILNENLIKASLELKIRNYLLRLLVLYDICWYLLCKNHMQKWAKKHLQYWLKFNVCFWKVYTETDIYLCFQQSFLLVGIFIYFPLF